MPYRYQRTLKRTILGFIAFLLCFSSTYAAYNVKTVDFLGQQGLKINAAGPLIVKPDPARNRLFLVNTNTSSVSIIDAKTYRVSNIPVKTRVPQYLKMEAVAIDTRTGNLYTIGTHCLHIVIPPDETSVTVDTGEQYEMVSVDENTGDAFLVGRASPFLAVVRFKSHKVDRIKWVDQVEKMINLNQTPPPPIRKIICDNSLQQVIALDGFTSTIHTFSLKSNRFTSKRTLGVQGGARWHFAGYNRASHSLYVVIETNDRVVNEAVKIDIVDKKDIVVKLPGLHEGVGININSKRDEVYIPYDNDPSIHVVNFKNNGSVEEIKIPNFGNDASAVDEANDRLYVTSWGYGDVEVIDIASRKFIKNISNVGIIPHMFNIAFNPVNEKYGELVIPLGASAVNGSFGAALTVVNPETEKINKVYTGWAPTALAEFKSKEGMLVFNSEDQFAHVRPDGSFTLHTLPSYCRYVNNALEGPSGHIFVTYGPHQSYWPAVYIWAAKNGVLGIDPDTMQFYDRRIPRMAHRFVIDKTGVFYLLQNNWGQEKPFLLHLPDEVRSPNPGSNRIEFPDSVTCETTQRLLQYDPGKHWLYLSRLGETNTEPGLFQIFDPATRKTLLTYPSGLTPTDIAFNNETVYIANFDSDTVTAVNKQDFSVQPFKTGPKPFKLAVLNDKVYVINHNDNTLQTVGKDNMKVALPYPGKPGMLFAAASELIIVNHTPDTIYIYAFKPQANTFELIHKEDYPYGETTVDTDNSAFYLRGQFGDGLFEISRIKQDKSGRLWITDYLSGKLFIISI